MKTKGRIITAATAGAVLVCVSALWGQVVPSQDGRELDASPALGSRYNVEAPSGPQINSQLYITGQVTGLGYFHGSPGYTAPDQLQTNIPSAGLSDFNRRAVGMSEALGGQTYLTSPYYSRSQTVLGADSILSGLAVPGSNVPVAPVAPIPSATSFGRQLYIDALADYRATEASRSSRVLSTEAPVSLPETKIVIGPPTGRATGLPILLPTDARDSLRVGDLFNIGHARQQEDLARELYFQAHPDQVVARREAIRDQDTGAAAKVAGGLSGAVAPGQGAAQPAPEARQADANAVTLGGPIGNIPGMPSRNQDVFMDMLLTLRQARQTREMEVRRTKNQPLPEVAPAPLMPRVPGALVESQGGGEMVIHSLAGEGRDVFNARMTQAGRQLRENQYYEAAYTYETAGLHDQRNPLPRLGRGLSLLGAGESLSAAYEIERAVQMFPPLTEARLDLGSIMGAQALERQLEGIDKRIVGATPEARQRLQFLATFLYFNSQQYDKAKYSAQKLVSDIQADALLRTYAKQVLDEMSGKAETPKPEATPQPTESTGTGSTGATPKLP